MGQSKPIKSSALIVEDDGAQQLVLSILLEESRLHVIACTSAEAAVAVLQERGDSLALLMTDVNLAGHMDGVELAYIAKRKFPDLHVIVTSGRSLVRDLPAGTTFWPKPWKPLDVIREVQSAMY